MNTPSDSTHPFTFRRLDFRPLGVVALAIAAVWSTAIAAGTWHDVRASHEKHTIRVTGSAKKRIVADLIQWEAEVKARASDRTAAYQILREGSDKVVAFLAAQGIKAEEIQPQSTTFEEEFEKVIQDKVLPGTSIPLRTETKVSKGFLTRQSILVRSTDVPRVAKAAREVTSLLAQGVAINSENPEYFYTPIGELKLEMLAMAAKDARARAENILHSAGNAALSKLIVADMGIININPANATKTSEEGNNDTSALEKDIITIVHVEFEVD